MRIGVFSSPAHTIPHNEKRILAPWVLTEILVNRLVDRGHEVTLFAPEGSKTIAKLETGGVTSCALRRDDFSNAESFYTFVQSESLKLFRHMISVIKKQEIEVVHVHQAIDQLYPALVEFPIHIPVVCTFHDPITPDRFDGLTKASKLPNVFFISISRAQQHGAPFPFAGVVYNGVDTKLFTPDNVIMGSVTRSKSHLYSSPPSHTPVSGSPLPTFTPTAASTDLRVMRGEMRADGNPLRVPPTIVRPSPLLITGRITPEKGFKDAIAAARASGERLMMVGQNFSNISGSSEYFEREIRPQIDGKTIFWESVVKQEHLVGHYQQAKALLFPIHWEEPFGLVMIEAMACGTPVVAYNHGSVPEIVVDGKTGFIVEEKDKGDKGDKGNWVIQKTGIEGLVEAIGRIGQIDRAACRTHVVENFSLENMVTAYEAVYKRLGR